MATEETTAQLTTITEYGIRQPNGNEVWDAEVKVRVDQYSTRPVHLKEIHASYRRREQLIAFLRETATDVGTPVDEFIAGHTLITRQRLVTVLPPVTVERLDLSVQSGNLPF